MNLSTLTDAIALQGYGVYVWPAYIAMLAGLLIEPWLIRRRTTRARALAREQGCATQFGDDDAAAWSATRLPGEDA
jgi:heme exporter protein CcmD